MDLRQMEYLVALADEQQFTRAAAVCGVSQSGLSAAVRSLEDELGATLFDRTTRSVTPTAAGRALLPHARTLLAQATAARSAVARTAAELSGRLRVGSEQCLGFVHVNTYLEQIHLRHPLIELEFTQAGSLDLAARVREGDLDVAFIASAAPADVEAVERIDLGRQPLVVLAPPGHALAGRGTLEWSDLDGLDTVDLQESWAIRALNDDLCAQRGIARRVRCAVTDVPTLLDLVRRRLGVAIVPLHVASKPEASGLARIALPADAPLWTVSVITPLVATTAAGPSPASLLLDLVQAAPGR